MLHILRESSLDKAIAFYGDTTQIPDDNMMKMEELGRAKLENLFSACMRVEQN